jgi:hypothetical protein
MYGVNLIMVLKTIIIQWNFNYEITRNSSLRLLSLLLSYNVVNFELQDIYIIVEKHRTIQTCFITYNIKIKGNTPYPILPVELGISTIESMTMTRYLIYTNKIKNTENKRIHNIASNSSKDHPQLKKGCHKDVKSWLNH